MRGLLVAAAALVGLAALPQRPHPPRGAPVQTAPLEYFERQCARCHGPQGSFYGESFGKGLSDEALRRVVKEMAEGPGQAPLFGADLEAQVAYHRALIRGEPFLVWTKRHGRALQGEVSPEAKVAASVGGRPIPVRVREGRWSVRLPGNASARALVLTAKREGKATVFELSRAAWSHER